ncbi:alpha-galactosidase [Actinoplanes sp. KI2]|uniref:alpha-galactosidase D n=1 Tax=Actinoplanes sp. KI2 TaxID=2983315 RepID=UPI0021D5E387|nr:alpha-galactosidase [Actinoplanes sp. KI2]MCU7727101.1 alpha-galactosidase [Actinoplanes sp. KI2]
MKRPQWVRAVAVTLGATAGLAVAAVDSARPAAASDNGLSIRPAMGWSSWSFVRRSPTAAVIEAQADALRSSGLAAHGFVYVNLDDFWMKCDSNGPVVDGNGRWVVDTAKFPGGMKTLADHVHNDGLKFGLYVTPGIAQNAVTRNTPIAGTSHHAADIADTSVSEKNYNCKHMYGIDYGRAGAQEFVNSWAAQFASWGVDYLKIDGVGSQDIPDVQAWATALRATGRPINYALSNNLAIADAATWRQSANSWRTQGDVECYCGPGPNGSGYPITDWPHVVARFASAASWQPWAGPGGWNDLDSLEIGNGDQIGLTADQRRSQFTLWAMAASPLLLGADLTHLDSTDKAMLTNDRLIAVDQDGVAAKRIVNSGTKQVFAKREADGSYAVALFNTATSGSATVSVNWSQVGFAGSATVTDLWSGSSQGTVTGSYSATLRPGETRLIRAVPSNPGAVTVEAEATGNTLAGAVTVAACATCSGGAKVRFIGNGAANYETVKNVTVAAAGNHELTITYEVDGTRTFSVSVNGGGAIEVPVSGASWSTPASVTVTVAFAAGANTLTFANPSAYAPDLDRISVS